MVKSDKSNPIANKSTTIDLSVEIRFIFIPDGNENEGVAAIELAASKCPPDTCI